MGYSKGGFGAPTLASKAKNALTIGALACPFSCCKVGIRKMAVGDPYEVTIPSCGVLAIF